MIEINIITIIVVIATIIFSMVIHEVTHGYIGYLLGDNTAKYEGRLTLNPINHIDPFATLILPTILFIVGLPPFGAAKPVPVNKYNLKWGEVGSAIVAFCGPLSNLILAGIGSLLVNFIQPVGITADIVYTFVAVNISFFIFNLIPFPPLDGSRVLYALAPNQVRDFMDRIENFGLMAIFFFMFLIFPVIRPVVIEVNNSILRILL